MINVSDNNDITSRHNTTQMNSLSISLTHTCWVDAGQHTWWALILNVLLQFIEWHSWCEHVHICFCMDSIKYVKHTLQQMLNQMYTGRSVYGVDWGVSFTICPIISHLWSDTDRHSVEEPEQVMCNILVWLGNKLISLSLLSNVFC